MSRPFAHLVLIAAAFSASAAFASIEQAPPNFPYQDGEAVFVDFQKASFHLVYDLAAKSVTVESEITFDAPAKGYPIFDLIPEPRNVKLDDREVSATQIADPDRVSKFRVLGSAVSQGSHRMTMTHTISENVSFRATGVASAFWMSDLDDRQYLEQYLPANFEYDQYPTSMRIEIVNAAGKPHVLRANGAVTTVSENVFQVEFPAFYTTSSMFFHLSPKAAIASSSFTVKSVDGRALPVEVYTNSNLESYVAEVKRVIAELEGDYGPFPHAKVIVYGNGMGGMEYSGATVSSLSAVGHELFHSYNARAVMPAQGNSGWIDEAMSSWRDNHYNRRTSAGSPTKMAGHSVWTRMTDDDAYSKGADFMAWIAGRMAAGGKDFKSFLREYFKTNFYHTMTTDQLRVAMETYGGLDLGADFDQYIYGRGSKSAGGSVWPATKKLAVCEGETLAKPIVANPFHPSLTKQQLLDLL